MASSNQGQYSNKDMMKNDKHNNEWLINQNKLVQRKLTALELAKQYLSEVRNQSIR